MSWDFPTAGSDAVHHSAPLGNIPNVEQERILVEELLYVLSGFDGDYIRAVPLITEIDERKFHVDDSKFAFEIHSTRPINDFSFQGIDESLKEMVRRFSPILASYSVIQRFYESRSGFDHGMVNDALAFAIGQLIHDYRIFICQLESLLLKADLSLQKTWYYISCLIQIINI